MDVTINETAIPIPEQVNTWGELLDWLETDHLKAGECITRVLIDGREEINYRMPPMCGQTLDSVSDIAVESGDFDKVVRESLTELNHEIRTALASTREITRLLETRQEDQAYTQLAQLLDSIGIFFAVFSEEIGWVENSEEETTRTALSARLEGALTQLITAQENRFWVAICDVLEYEITPILEAWQELTERTRVKIN
jgi:hypothetical protein